MAAGCREVRGEAGGNNPESMAVVSDPARWLRAIKIAGLWKSLTENYAEEYINSQESLVHERVQGRISLSLSLSISRFFLEVGPPKAPESTFASISRGTSRVSPRDP
jgi:hypothetical protein